MSRSQSILVRLMLPAALMATAAAPAAAGTPPADLPATRRAGDTLPERPAAPASPHHLQTEPTSEVGGGNLHSAVVTLQLLSPTLARVSSTYRLTSAVLPTFLVAWQPGQKVTGLRVLVNGTSATARLSGSDLSSIRHLVVESSSLPDEGEALVELQITYSVELAAASPFAYPVPVAIAPPTAATTVHIGIRLPYEQYYLGDGLPQLRRADGTGRGAVGFSGDGSIDLEADLPAMPSSVRAVFGPQPPPLLDYNDRLELIAVLLVALPTVWWVLRRRRGERGGSSESRSPPAG